MAAVMIMLTLSKPKRLLGGYLCGAALTSVICGLVLVFALPNSSTSNAAKHNVNPVLTIALGALILVVVAVVATGPGKRRQAWRERRRRKARGKAAASVAARTEQGVRTRMPLSSACCSASQEPRILRGWTACTIKSSARYKR